VPHLAVIDPITKKIDWDQMALDERPGVYVLPIDESGRIGLVRKWRPIPQVEGWELPQGYSRDGERPGDTALRELREEVGDYEIEKVLILRGRSLSKSAFLIHGQPVVLIYVGEKLSDPPEDKNEIILDRHFFFLDEIPMLSVDSEIIGADDRGIIARYKDLLDLKKLPC
jgi:ADP-ribose pyrophosphatase